MGYDGWIRILVVQLIGTSCFFFFFFYRGFPPNGCFGFQLVHGFENVDYGHNMEQTTACYA